MLFGKLCGRFWKHRGMHTAAGSSFGEICQPSHVTVPISICSSDEVAAVWVGLPTACHLKLCNCFTPLSHTVCESFLPAMKGGSTYFWTRGSSSIPCSANGWDEDSRFHTISSLCLQHLKRYHSNHPLSKKNGTINASTRWGTSKNTYETTWRTADQQSCPLPATTFIRVFYRVLLCPSFALLSNVLEHALDCKKGGIVIKRRNVIRDALGNIALWLTGSNKGANSERS